MTSRQRAFVAAYLTTWNAAESARRAGYAPASARQTGRRLLQTPAVAEAIKAELQGRNMIAAEALEGLAAQARGDMADFAAELGYPQLREARDAGRLDTRLIHKFDLDRQIEERKDGTRITRERVKLELYNAQNARALILKASGDLEETIIVRYERGLEELFGFIIDEFSKEGDEATLDRIERVLTDYQARNG